MRVRPEGAPLISEVLYPREPYENEPRSKHEMAMQDIVHAQPATVAVSVGAYEIFTAAGCKADFVAGHSVGEISALFASGCLDRDVAFELVCRRAAAISAASNHKSRVVGLCADELDTFGLQTMESARRDFESVISATIGSFKYCTSTQVYSNFTGAAGYRSPDEAAELLGSQMTSRVRWADQVRAMYRDGARVFIEFGPGSSLAALTEDALAGLAVDACTISVHPSKNKSSDLQLREAAVQLAVIGVPLQDFDPWGVSNRFTLGR